MSKEQEGIFSKENQSSPCTPSASTSPNPRPTSWPPAPVLQARLCHPSGLACTGLPWRAAWRGGHCPIRDTPRKCQPDSACKAKDRNAKPGSLDFPLAKRAPEEPGQSCQGVGEGERERRGRGKPAWALLAKKGHGFKPPIRHSNALGSDTLPFDPSWAWAGDASSAVQVERPFVQGPRTGLCVVI